MGNCHPKKSKPTLEKLENDIIMISSDQRRQTDHLLREMLSLKQTVRKYQYDASRRYTVCHPANYNEIKYI